MRALVVLLLMCGAVRAEPTGWPLDREKIGKLGLSDSAEAVVKQLGNPTSKDAPQEEGATGEFVSQWTFPDGVVLTMSAPKAKGPFTVRGIALASPSKLKNTEGLGIGSTLAAVKKAYGKWLIAPESGSNGWLVGSPYGGMLFTVDKDKVTAIFLGPMAE